MKTGALLSDCRKYRYKLWRIWDESKPKVMWVMHNPSKADESENDRTINKIIRFSKRWGYGGIYVGNLIPYRETYSNELLKRPFSEVWTPDNMIYINEMIKECQLHILAYGNPVIKDCIPEFFDDHWHYLRLTKSGNPWHPLYLPEHLTPIKMNACPTTNT